MNFVQKMKEIANEEKMEFIDGAKETMRGLKILVMRIVGEEMAVPQSTSRFYVPMVCQ